MTHINNGEQPDKAEDVEFAVLLLKPKGGQLKLQAIQQYPGVDDIDDLYKEICVLKANLEAQKAAAMFVQATMKAAMEAQGVHESGLVTPPGVKN